MQTNCTAFAKVVVNKRLQTYRVLFSFDIYNKITVHNAVLVTGDICDIDNENANMYIDKAIIDAKNVLRTDNIVFATH